MAASKASDPTPAMRRLVRRYQLDRVELVCSGNDIIARAYPSRHGMIVRQRYEAAIAAADKAEFQIAELTELRERATEGQLAHATGSTVSAALAALESALAGIEAR
jgi:hypothetical protein